MKEVIFEKFKQLPSIKQHKLNWWVNTKVAVVRTRTKKGIMRLKIFRNISWIQGTQQVYLQQMKSPCIIQMDMYTSHP
jgi:hypothetical protein